MSFCPKCGCPGSFFGHCYCDKSCRDNQIIADTTMNIIDSEGNIVASIENAGGGKLMIPDEILYQDEGDNGEDFIETLTALMKKAVKPKGCHEE